MRPVRSRKTDVPCPRRGTPGQGRGPSRWAFAAWVGVVLTLSMLVVGSRPASAFSTTIETMYSELEWPTAFAFAPDGRLFFAERYSGSIRIIENGTLLPDPFFTFSGLATFHDEGLLGLALDPSFPAAPWVYAYYSFNDTDAGEVYNRIVRVQADGNLGGPMEVVLDRIPNGVWHIGGPIQFGPDGTLFALIGDTYAPEKAQDLTTVSGKVLRMNPDGTVPDDNPFVDNASVNPYIYAYGIRNAFGIAFHPATGSAIITENGPECNDEVDLLIPGRNYGWGPSWSCVNPPPDPLNTNRDGPDPVLPMTWYTPNIAPTNAIVYNGSSFAPWQGDFFFGTWNTRNIHRLDLAPPTYDTVLDDEIVATLPDDVLGGVLDVEIGPDGAIWFSSMREVYRLVDISQPPVARFTASPSTPLVGADVTFDGSASFDPDGSILNYTWDFGDGSSGSGVVVTHAYGTHGVFVVTLAVTDSDGMMAIDTQSVRVLGMPTASFTYAPPSPLRGTPVTFDASGSTGPNGNLTEYRWEWGDGSDPVASASAVEEHTFATFGGFVVNLTVTDAYGLSHATSSRVSVFAAPFASFAYSPPSPVVGESVVFDASASTDPDGEIVSYEWSFGDGATGDGPIVAHSYAERGTYVVVLTVADAMDFTSAKATTLTVQDPNVDPVATFAVSSPRVNPLEPITFNGSASTDSDGSIVTYSWDFGDFETDRGPVVSHSYAAPGTYTVRLTVTDDRGGTHVVQTTVLVNAPPIAAFSMSTDLAYPGVSVRFDASASSDPDDDPLAYSWEFGDGATAQGILVGHTYGGDRRTFTVRLTVADDLGAQGARERTVGIGNRPPQIASTSPQPASLANVAESTTFMVSAFDPDGDPLTYTWSVDGVPAGVSSRQFDFAGREVGTFLVKVVVSDGSATVDFEWTVEVRAPPAEPPWVVASTVVGVAALIVSFLAWRLRRRSR
jgi:glucose/arabinose dehydrogenase/chitodextrinase